MSVWEGLFWLVMVSSTIVSVACIVKLVIWLSKFREAAARPCACAGLFFLYYEVRSL